MCHVVQSAKKRTNEETLVLENVWKSGDGDVAETNDNIFSIKSFCTACSWGWLIVGCLAFFISAFFVLPVPTIQLAQYLENTIQIIIVILAFLVTYKIFSVEETAIAKFLHKFRRNYHNKDISDDAEAAGAMLNDVVLDIEGVASSNLDLLLKLNPKTLELLKGNPENHNLLLQLAPCYLKLLLRLTPENLNYLLQLTTKNLKLLLKDGIFNRIIPLNPISLQHLLKFDPNIIQLQLPPLPGTTATPETAATPGATTTPEATATPETTTTAPQGLSPTPPLQQQNSQTDTPAHDNLNLLLMLHPAKAAILELILDIDNGILDRIILLNATSLQQLLQIEDLTVDNFEQYLNEAAGTS